MAVRPRTVAVAAAIACTATAAVVWGAEGRERPPAPSGSVGAGASGPSAQAAARRTPLDFGAVGDGRADDTAALQAALDSLDTGDTLVLPAGRVFRHSDVLVVGRAGSRVEGPGALLASREDRSSLQVQADDVQISSLVLRMTGTTRRWSGLEQHRLVLGPVEGAVVSGVRVEGAAGAGVYVGGATGFRISDVTVSGTRADGVHMTSGASRGLVERPVVTGAGDDGVAVVSYQGDSAPSRDITVLSPRVSGNSHGRGVSVVGGEDITYRDVRVRDSSAAAVYVATEGAPFFTRSTRRVRVLGVQSDGANRTPSVDHGAVLLYAGAQGSVVEDVLVSDARIVGTRPGAARQVGLLADGGRVTGVRLERFRVDGGGSVFESTAAPTDHRAVDWVVDGRPVADSGTA